MSALDDLVNKSNWSEKIINGITPPPFDEAADELAALRAERDEAVKFIKHLKYLVEAEDVNAALWYIRKYEVKP